MATQLYVVCRSAAPITYAELERVMAHMSWLDRPARFEPPTGSTSGADPYWRSFSVQWDPSVPPIRVTHVFERARLDVVLDDVREQIDDAELVLTPAIEELLRSAEHVIVFDIEGVPRDDVWDMLDAVEAHLVREHDGVIVAREGLFDGAMQKLT